MLGRYRYTASTLTPGEEIELVGRLHYFALIIPFGLTSASVFAWFAAMSYSRTLERYNSTVLTVAVWLPVVALVIFTIASWLKRNLIEMVCTNKRVVKRTGIINVTTEELNRERIESVEIRQSIFGRLFNYGDILFSGTGTSKVVFSFINQPRLMKQVIDEVISRPN
ncbi:MAG: PH domain-containing protein [Alphaproteobacteria bacterium]|nr:PH domain-containing protein [Alphaproteobacteria bacterium]MBQ2811340.1 PH domain-containing protein [Alphaproteobacteria bacterium]